MQKYNYLVLKLPSLFYSYITKIRSMPDHYFFLIYTPVQSTANR